MTQKYNRPAGNPFGCMLALIWLLCMDGLIAAAATSKGMLAGVKRQRTCLVGPEPGPALAAAAFLPTLRSAESETVGCWADASCIIVVLTAFWSFWNLPVSELAGSKYSQREFGSCAYLGVPSSDISLSFTSPGKCGGGATMMPVMSVQDLLAYKMGHWLLSGRAQTRTTISLRASRIRCSRRGPAAKSMAPSSSSSGPPSCGWSSCLRSKAVTASCAKFTKTWAWAGVNDRGTRSMAQSAPRRNPSDVTRGEPA
mmetsp:Transcript_77902/g.197967  ORF Transcript_77902/g.197967 Transcript_77902/m.197967 type:complete len:255 (-) Transcript_77902:189-953(-)